MEKNTDEEIILADGDFLDEMKRIERKVLAEIDPEALKRFDEEDKRAGREAE
ncbi:MAG: hypothetical protein J6C33_10470 [Lachnospiraceae bacterium]|nr:hypothetical protein [Lachnospiraceae bacterium]